MLLPIMIDDRQREVELTEDHVRPARPDATIATASPGPVPPARQAHAWVTGSQLTIISEPTPPK